ncbi:MULTISPECIES: phage tail tip lysozyme [unclassified Bradyrhizobium]|uniref:phage tail tip lysozyme n=1 Tax=unclassified Bradyrhizobium TaxID=2631580 RepID=UPI002915F4F9|nr:MULTISPECIES: phage tail tip lysozyme [unclassified Bradyrhizobium]
MNGDDIYHGLLNRGYSAPRAAALTGNILQESGGDPSNLNQKEGAYGLLQWRLDRRQGLENFAASRGTSAADPNTQLDYIGVEMGGPERRSATGFLNSEDVSSANAALKNYIRYGDDSQGKRLAYAQGFLPSGDAPSAAPMAMGGPQAGAGSAAPADAPSATAETDAAPPASAKAPAPQSWGPAPVDLAALTAVPQLRNILPPRPNYFGLETAPFSLKG